MKKILLTIDIGNTNTVIGIFSDKELVYDWRISTDREKTIDEYGLTLKQIFDSKDLNLNYIDDIIISSVVPNIMDIFPAACEKYFNIKPMIIGPGVKTGMNILYDNPKEVGADRIVNGVGAFEKYRGPLIIVDLGTAITFDVINEKGQYLGGAIAPGVKISADALFQRASKLPKIEIKKPEKIIGKNTINSMQAGFFYGFVGMIDSIIEKMIEELDIKKEDIKVIATGGFSKLFINESKYIQISDTMLTLDGLRIIYERNQN